MTECDVEMYLQGDQIKEVTREKPAKAAVLEVNKREPKELPYHTDKPAYELTVQLGKDVLVWTANDKSLRNFVYAWGRGLENWKDKEIQLWTVLKDVFGEQKYVIYGAPIMEKPKSLVDEALEQKAG